MRLSYSIPITTGIFLILTAIVNIGAFQIFSEKYFANYADEIAKSEVTPDPTKIQSLLQIGDLDLDDQKEYLSILSELSKLTTSIENISDNPELYMTSATFTGDTILSIPVSMNHKSYVPIFRLSALSEGTPEGKFVRNTLRDIILVNAIWLLLLLFGYSYWVRSLFHPITTVTNTLQNIIDRRRYASIRFRSKNEFTPLVQTINNLHRSLSIQEKIRSDFLSDLSHEIRTPITAVNCYLEAIQDGVMKLDKKTVDHLQSELQRLTHITGKIMDYESLTHDVFDDINIDRFSLRKITDDIVRQYKPQLIKTNQTIETIFPTDSMTSMDKNMFIQVLHNLISNFIKYAGEGTTLQIHYEKNTTSYIITFQDNGVGIPESEISFVKEKFYRVDKGRNQGDKSMGIGLSIVDRIASLHGGSFTVQKNTPQGVKFTLRIGR